ncbi:MAG: helix-turn-helix domain-containing protein [Alphaproteobacteria bacterium]|nr:helix-turn-helix domain-containing protein [Alphaproteobacteria bacterium]
MDTLNELGIRVRDARNDRGWTQRELAKRAGMSLRFLGQLEGGTANVSVVRLAEVASALGVSLVTLVAGLGDVRDAADRIAGHVATLDPAASDALLGAATPARVAKIALIGLRGAGKSTIGRAAADALGWPFVELDASVQQRAGLRLSDLFEMHGSAGYHRFCREALEDLVATPGPAVVEVGGSVVADAACWALLDRHTRVVWLRASPRDHLDRVAAQGDTRPMQGFRDALARLQGLLDAREPLYRRADVTIDTGAGGIEGSVERLREVAATVAP